MANGICEPLWIKIILGNLSTEVRKPMLLYCDNKATINLVHTLVHHDQTKHLDRHFRKEKLDSGLVCIPTLR